MTEAVLRDAEEVEAHVLNDLADSLAGVAVQLLVDVFKGVEQEGEGNDVQALIKAGIDEVGVRGEVDRAVDDALDTLGLVAGGQLVGGIDLNGHGAAGGVADHLAELAAHVCPAGVVRRGAGELPSLLLKGSAGSGGGAGAAGGSGGAGAAGGGGGAAGSSGSGGGAGAAAARGQGHYHDQSKRECKKLFHCFSSLKIWVAIYLMPLSRQ